jgi:hypothetical protein
MKHLRFNTRTRRFDVYDTEGPQEGETITYTYSPQPPEYYTTTIRQHRNLWYRLSTAPGSTAYENTEE